MADDETSSYIDYETFTDPSFSATSFANTLVLSTNNPSDSPIDLKTPLSRVLFDAQEADTHIDKLTSTCALPLLSNIQDNVEAGSNVLEELESQVATLTEGYNRLHREIIERFDTTEQVRLATDRLWHTVQLGRLIGRCLTLGRQLETYLNEIKRPSSGAKREDHRAMIRGAGTLLGIREILSSEGQDLAKVTLMRTLTTELVDPSERLLSSRAEQIVGQFSMSALSVAGTDSSIQSVSTLTYAQSEDTKSRTSTALSTLYLLSPVAPISPQHLFEPLRLTNVLQDYLKRAVTSSLAGLQSALAALPKLDRTLLEVSARCQNIAALEVLLESTKPPVHPLLPKTEIEALAATEGNLAPSQQEHAPINLLRPLLDSLDTSSLPSYFWRTMASQLSPRVQKILKEGGVSARTLRSNRGKVSNALRDCVNRGSQLPASSLSRGKGITVRNWEREAAVMMGALNSALGR